MKKIRNGLDIPISGSPEHKIADFKKPRSVALLGADYHGLKPSMLVKEGETVTFQESSAQARVSTLDSPSFAIGSNYTFADGGESTFYDYGIIKRKPIKKETAKSIQNKLDDCVEHNK